MKYKPITNQKPVPFKNGDYKKLGKFHKAYKYKNKKGEWIYCTVCYILDGKRNYHKFIYEGDEWVREINIKNNVLYNLDDIIKYPEKEIVIVDEETSIKILEETNADDFIFTTFTGHPENIESTDFSPLTDRKVYYFSGSWTVSKVVRKYLKLKRPKFFIVEPMVNSTGWNITDNLPAMKVSGEIIRSWIVNLQDTFEEIEKQKNKEKKPHKTIENCEYPFQLLGYNQGYMYFLPGETGQIFKIKQGSLSKQHLTAIAPLEFWQQIYGYETKNGVRVAWEEAIDILIRNCYAIGPFDKNNIRGRGAWRDEKNNLVIHTGKYIIVNNKKIEVKDYKIDNFIYERLPELPLTISNEIINKNDLDAVLECFTYLAIETKLQLYLLIGWCILAPFGGALKWKPHIWITGRAGTGKTQIIQKIIWEMLGPFKICPKGDSSAAGLLQHLVNDSFSVCYDEAEPSTHKINNIRAILDIARAASSAGGEEKLLKGTADQTGRIYETNSMFCLGSVNTLLTQKSDTRRFSIINIEKNNKIPWKDFLSKILKAFSIENCDKIRAYIYNNWKIINENIENFKNAVGVYTGEMGLGDQIGTLLAGAASFMNMKIYTYDECLKICEEILKDFAIEEDQISDELECLLTIMTSKITYINNSDKREDTTLINLINMAAGQGEYVSPCKRAERELYKYGIKYSLKENKIYIAINYKWIKDILKNTSWEHNYATTLRRLEMIDEKSKVVGFGSYLNARALGIDAEYIFRLSNDEVFIQAGF